MGRIDFSIENILDIVTFFISFIYIVFFAIMIYNIHNNINMIFNNGLLNLLYNFFLNLSSTLDRIIVSVIGFFIIYGLYTFIINPIVNLFIKNK